MLPDTKRALMKPEGTDSQEIVGASNKANQHGVITSTSSSHAYTHTHTARVSE